jgi:hypothetical protein
MSDVQVAKSGYAVRTKEFISDAYLLSFDREDNPEWTDNILGIKLVDRSTAEHLMDNVHGMGCEVVYIDILIAVKTVSS